MPAVTEWQDIAIEAVKGTVVLIIMERLFLTRNSSWLEVRGAPRGAAAAWWRSDAHAAVLLRCFILLASMADACARARVFASYRSTWTTSASCVRLLRAPRLAAALAC